MPRNKPDGYKKKPEQPPRKDKPGHGLRKPEPLPKVIKPKNPGVRESETAKELKRRLAERKA